MLNPLVLVQEKQKKEAEAAAQGVGMKQSAGELRAQKDVSEIDLPKGSKLHFPKGPDHIMEFDLILTPDEGPYTGGIFLFHFDVPQSYPHDPPKVKCLTKIYHPNIDIDGNICLNILREDWKPVLTITSIVYGLNFLLLAPNPEDPLNKEAATMMRSDINAFQRAVRTSITRGCRIDGEYFPPATSTRP